VAAFPDEMSPEVIADILRGGADKVAEGGGIIVGGHTITDQEPKYGLSVMGLVHPQRVFTKGGARVGDVLYLTKPLGTGIIATAGKFGEAREGHLEAAIEGMKRLNRHPSHIVRELGAHCLTDVTGFGLLGHAYEMVAASSRDNGASVGGTGIAFRIVASQVPLLDGVLTYAARGITTGGEARNRSYLEDKVRIRDGVSDDLKMVLYDPQTSGGLLFTVESEKAATVERRFAESGLDVWPIGEAVAGEGVEVVP
jgi:selenide,water dikinase